MPLIGQTDAAAAIQAGVSRAFSLGAPTLVALEGGRGSGKTRLLIHASEVAAQVDGDNVLVLYASCRDGGEGGYAPFSRLLLERFGVTPSSSPSAVRAQMSALVGELLNTQEAVAIAETTHLLGHVAGIPFPDSPFLAPLEKQPGELHDRCCQAIQRFIAGEASERPVLLLLDNMHWADDSAWDVIARLGNGAGHLSMVVAGDAPVSEQASKIDPPGGFAIGPIAPLDEPSVNATLNVLLPGLYEAPEPLLSAITHRSGGNPSAIRELTYALWEAGLFLQTERGLEVDLRRLSEGTLPVSMEDAIQARIERLNALERATLERAAVIGEIFWDGAIVGQMRSERPPPGTEGDPLSIWSNDDDQHALASALLKLEELGFVEALDRSDLPGAREYTFTVDGTRRLLYGELDDGLRIRRHAAVARWLALVGQHQREGVAAMIAPHLEAAGQTQRAGRAYLEAAHYERAQLRTHRALDYVDRALRHISEDDVVRRIEGLHTHGSLHHVLGHYEDARSSFASMLRHAWGIGSRSKGGAALNRLARINRAQGDDEGARKLLTRALELFRGAGDLRGVASTLDDLAEISSLRGELTNAAQQAHEALEIRKAHGDIRGEAVSLNTLARIEIRRGKFETAEKLLTSSLEKRINVGDAAGAVQAHNALGVLSYSRGDHEGAIREWRNALDRAREIADRRSECFLLNNMGEARMHAGALDEADISLGQALELAEQGNDRRALAEVKRNLGMLALKRGESDAATRLEEALELAREYGAPEAIAYAHRALGMQRAQTLFGDNDGLTSSAEEELTTSIQLFQELGNALEAARSTVELAKHFIERGDEENARTRLREARLTFRRMNLVEESMAIDRMLNALV